MQIVYFCFFITFSAYAEKDNMDSFLKNRPDLLAFSQAIQ